jgi:hypothetical protein
MRSRTAILTNDSSNILIIPTSTSTNTSTNTSRLTSNTGNIYTLNLTSSTTIKFTSSTIRCRTVGMIWSTWII